MKKHLLLLVLAVVILCFCLVGCGNTATDTEATADTKVVANVDGTEITVPTNIEKIGALYGPSYEKLYMLNVEDKIACDGDFHINGWPWSNVIYQRVNEVSGIPNAHSDLNIEDLMQYNLDVVFNFANPQTTASMEEVGIYVVPAAYTGDFTEVRDTVNVYAQVLGGDAIEIADRYSKYFDEKSKMITDITSQIPEEDKYRVYFANQEILWTAGNQSDIVEMIEMAGGICVHADVEGGCKTEISQEQLLAWDPEFIFVDHAGSSGNDSAEEVILQMTSAEELQQISAIKDDKVFIVPTGVFFWDGGVQKILMLQWIAKTMYPDLFPDLDMQEELKTFYTEFFRYDLTDTETTQILNHQNP